MEWLFLVLIVLFVSFVVRRSLVHRRALRARAEALEDGKVAAIADSYRAAHR